jgi:hypothetical protein
LWAKMTIFERLFINNVLFFRIMAQM